MSMSRIYERSVDNLICYVAESDVKKLRRGSRVGVISLMVELLNQLQSNEGNQSWNLKEIKEEIEPPLLDTEQQQKVYNMIYKF